MIYRTRVKECNTEAWGLFFQCHHLHPALNPPAVSALRLIPIRECLTQDLSNTLDCPCQVQSAAMGRWNSPEGATRTGATITTILKIATRNTTPRGCHTTVLGVKTISEDGMNSLTITRPTLTFPRTRDITLWALVITISSLEKMECFSPTISSYTMQ